MISAQKSSDKPREFSYIAKTMHFEGSEKKIEVIFKRNVGDLRARGKDYWQGIVEACGAKILSHISNENMDAYLLSESSLFVYDNYLTMITCGRTKLIQAVAKLFETFSPDDTEAFFYERKHEVFAKYQHSHFFEDIIQLNKWFDGEAMRFGPEDEHHLYLYSTTGNYTPEKDDHTMEVLMHGVSSQNIELFQKEGLHMAKPEIRKLSKVQSLIQGQVDDHIFDPCGYSLNAIDGPYYYTIHVTPERIGNYTSFETDAKDKKGQQELAKRVIEVFQPSSFDIVLFNTEAAPTMTIDGYQLKNSYQQTLKTGYVVQYLTFYLPQQETENAFIIQESDL